MDSRIPEIKKSGTQQESYLPPWRFLECAIWICVELILETQVMTLQNILHWSFH